MKLSELFSKLEKSPVFKKFKKQNKEAYFCAAFFVFDYEQKEDKFQLDYWVSEDDIETFVVSDKITQQKAQMAEKEQLKEIKKDEIKVDLPEVLGIVKKEAEKTKFNPSKIIVILQRLKESEQLIWNITGFSGFNLLRMHIAMDKKLLLNEKKSMMEMMKIERGNKGKEKTDYVG
jgi:heme-degrading monooxygenase HmoA